MNPILAHGEDVAEELLAWHPHFDVWVLLGVIVVGYAWGIRRFRNRYAPQGEPAITRRQIATFGLGIALWWVVSDWPIHDIAEGSLFSFHMLEHLVLALAVPPLLLLGTPWWFLRLVCRPFLGVLRFLTKPVVALLMFNAALALLHAPRVVELMVTNEAFHFAAHSSLMITATLMWFPVLGPIPDLPRLAPLGRIGYLFALSILPTIPAAWLTFARQPVYPVYETMPRLWGISVVDDQMVAGLIMKLGGGLFLWTIIAVIFFRWFAEEQRYSPTYPSRSGT